MFVGGLDELATEDLSSGLLERRTGDIERVLQWLFAEQRFGLPWYDDHELSFDKGLTAKPRRRPRDGWDIAKATAGQTNRPRAILRKRPANADANIIFDEIKKLEPHTASLIIKHARQGTRPDWLPGAKPEMVMVFDKRTLLPKHKRRGKHRNQRYPVMRWTVDPKVVAAARESYSAWHRGMERLWRGLSGRLGIWEISGFSAPEMPWQSDLEKSVA